MQKMIIFLILFVSLTAGVFAQEVVIDMDVEEQYSATHGPNMRHYGHFYSGLGVIPDFDEEQGAAINSWRSSDVKFGYRYKLKLLSFYAIGMDLSFRIDNFHLEGDEENPFDEENPLTFTTGEKKQVLRNNSIALEFYHRINIGDRGNTLGTYVDMGISGQWNHTVKEIIVKKFDEEYYGKQKLVNRKLDFYENFSYGVTGRIGYNKYSIYGHYRLSDYFNDNYNIPDLPRLKIGLEFAF